MSDSITFNIKPQWEEIDNKTDEINFFLKKQGFSEEVTHSLYMVTSELLENAIKYGCFQKKDKISCSISIEGDQAMVEVVNPVSKESQGNLRKLDETIQWIRGYQNPFQAYVERMKEVSVKALDDEESGLGLVRIAYEGKSILDFYVNEDNILSVSAIYTL